MYHHMARHFWQAKTLCCGDEVQEHVLQWHMFCEHYNTCKAHRKFWHRLPLKQQRAHNVINAAYNLMFRVTLYSNLARFTSPLKHSCAMSYCTNKNCCVPSIRDLIYSQEQWNVWFDHSHRICLATRLTLHFSLLSFACSIVSYIISYIISYRFRYFTDEISKVWIGICVQPWVDSGTKT